MPRRNREGVDEMDYETIGKRHSRLDALDQVTGKTKFTDDLYYHDMLYMKGLFSTEDHARILSIDTSAAKNLPGVAAVLTHEDVHYNASGFVLEDLEVLAKDKVLFRGQPVAIVAAETSDIAEDAVALIKVEYERLPAVFDAREAMKEGAPVLHEDKQDKWAKGNIVMLGGNEFQHLKHGGDIDEAFAGADVIVEAEFITQAQRCAPIEPTVFIAVPDASGGVHVIGSGQCPHNNQTQTGKIVNMPLNKLRISSPAVGGGFGQKNSLAIEPHVALMAAKTGRPVKWALTTAEDFAYAPTRLPVYMKYKLGAKKDGTLVAIDREHVCNAGAAATLSVMITSKITKIGSGAYRIPCQQAKTWIIYTNKIPTGAMRGFGMAQGTFAIESMMDILAGKLGMDPIELRLKNVLKDGDVTGTGQVLRAVGAQQVLETLRDKANWVAK